MSNDFRAQQELEEERYQALSDALDECVLKGVSVRSLHTLSNESCFNSKDLINLLQKDIKRMKAKLESLTT